MLIVLGVRWHFHFDILSFWSNFKMRLLSRHEQIPIINSFSCIFIFINQNPNDLFNSVFPIKLLIYKFLYKFRHALLNRSYNYNLLLITCMCVNSNRDQCCQLFKYLNGFLVFLNTFFIAFLCENINYLYSCYNIILLYLF